MNLAGLKAVMMDIKTHSPSDTYSHVVIVVDEIPTDDGYATERDAFFAKSDLEANTKLVEFLKATPAGWKRTVTVAQITWTGRAG